MTEKIEILELFKETFSGTDNINTINTAIRSLKAWEEVLNELEEKRKYEDSLGDLGYALGISKAIHIINQHLAEIEEAR